MNIAEERLRSAARDAARIFPTGGELPPLRLPDPATRHGRTRIRPGIGGLGRSRTWVSPLAAAAAVAESLRPRWPMKAWIAAVAAVAAAAAGIGVAESLPGRRGTHTVSSSLPVIGFDRGLTQGVATNAVKLVDYATRAAALTPAFVPGPHEWMYRDLIQKIGPHRNREVTWFEVNWRHMFVLIDGKVSPEGSSTGGCAGQLNGWPGCINNVYRYLATLPAEPAALRRILLANNHSDPAAAFRAIMGLLSNFPLPARFQAELYAVLTGLAGVHFDRSATDFAGRHGIGLYMIQTHFWKMEIIINPRTYTYMGVLVVAVKTHTEYGRHVRKGQIQAWNAMLGSGVVQKAGQRP
jgi:hypothetical protein